MKGASALVLAFVASLATFTACKKDLEQNISDQKQSVNLGIKQSNLNSKDLVLKAFSFGGRTYTIFYGPGGRVDSIRAMSNTLQYSYIVYYKGSRIDSVNLVLNGLIQSTNTNFQYKGNVITSFDYYYRGYSLPYFTTYTYTYDSKKRIQTLQATIMNTIISGPEQLNYDENNNVIEWTNTRSTTQYTYDNKLNPLYLVPNLFAIVVEEHFLWEFSFSQYNSISKSSTGTNVLYQNKYSNSGRLISKTYSGSGFTFTYF